MMNRYRLILTSLLMTLLIVGKAVAQVTVKGSVFGGGNEADVQTNTVVNISAGNVEGNVYGGGNLGDVGTIDKSDQTNYNYTWEKTNGTTANTPENNKITDTNNNTGICTVTITGGTIGTENGVTANYTSGHVFGAGKGSSTTWWCEKGIVFATNVSVSGSTVVYGTVYGGGEVGRVEDDAKVTIGTENGSGEGSKPDIRGDVFGAGAGIYTHGYSALLRGNTDVTIQGIAKVGGSVYGGGETASVGRFEVVKGLPNKPLSGGTCKVTIQDHAKIGISGTDHNVFGACKGVTPSYVATGDNRSMSMQLLTNKPTDDSLWSHYDNDENSPYIWRYYATEQDYLDFLKTLALTSHTDVTLDENSIVYGSVYGGGQRGITLGRVNVNMTNGEVLEDVYGGGALADTNTGNWDVNNDTWSDDTQKTALYTTTVNLTGGTIHGDAYGGGLGAADTPAYVWGDVTVDMNDIEETAKGCIVKHVFGCNNVNGTPKGKVLVHVYATQTSGESGDIRTKPALGTGTFDVEAVYGGGNLAAYMPNAVEEGNEASKPATHVIIEGCGLTSIRQVYGGGNAASTPATQVDINETYEIDEAFGGGNGKDVLPDGRPNPGANVGYTDYSAYETSTDENKGAATKDLRIANYQYGSGEARMNIHGGTVHRVYGGSNTKGNVRITAVTMLEDESGCPFDVEEAYGGGKSAPMDATSSLEMACIPGLDVAYGGAEDAQIEGDVNLTITNGTFDRVFGGNNVSGEIKGTITVNIEETGCKPIIIGQLYGGGNQAPYTVPAGKPGPTVNVRSFTSIGEVYGGGYGAPAKVTADTHVNINVGDGRYKNGFTYKGGETVADYIGEKQITFKEYERTYNSTTGKWDFVYDENGIRKLVSPDPSITITLPEKTLPSKIGAIQNVYGGGNAAEVDGDTYVNIGTIIDNDPEYTEIVVKTGESVEDFFIKEDGEYKKATGVAAEGTTYYMEYKVIGADIRGNVYGGGNNAKVTGNTHVTIGKEVTTTPGSNSNPDPTPEP
ncbi:MAG: hypothetical protein Q4D25_06460 [Bacteroidales bacterium]|nr:hypothetical protein [Bacteroidales bacterium]